jgi:hypothetical protein
MNALRSGLFLIFSILISIHTGFGDVAPSTVVRAGSLQDWNYYYGSVHNHTIVSGEDEAVGAPLQAYTYARDIAGLDFMGVADHAGGITAEEWQETKDAAEAMNEAGRFVTFWGFEWSPKTLGHITIVNTADYCSNSSKTNTNTVAGLIAWVKARPDGFAIFNHPGEKDSTGEEFAHFELPPCDQFVGMELWNKKDDFRPYYYAAGYFPEDGFNYFDEAQARNWYLGAWGGHDDHTGTWGTYNDYRACILSRDLSRAALIQAFRERRIYTSADKNLKLYFELGGGVMGSRVYAGADLPLIVELSDAGETFSRIDLIRNGGVQKSWKPSGSNVAIEELLQVTPGDWYYIRVIESDGDQAFSSPVWVEGSRPQSIDPSATRANIFPVIR